MRKVPKAASAELMRLSLLLSSVFGGVKPGVVIDSSDTRLTWQVSAGISCELFERTQLEIGYRHQRTEGLSFTARDGTVSSTDLVSNMVTMGIRRSF